MADIKGIDLYGLLDLTIESTEQDIRSAYRKKALKCHPDKNPDDAKAAENFNLLSKAIEILLDKSAREAYDKVIRRKEQIKIKNSKLDNTRKKFKEDLERREQEAENEYNRNKSDEDLLQQEVDRLRKEGSIKLREEIKLMKEELEAKLNLSSNNINPEEYRLRIKWKVKENIESKNETTSQYNQETLTKIFSKYGKINILVISTKKSSTKGSALLEYENIESAKQAKMYELGFPNNSLNVTFLNTELNSQINTSSNSNKIFKETKVNIEFPDIVNNLKTSNDSNSRSSNANIFPCTLNSNIFPSTLNSNIFPSTLNSNNMFPSVTNLSSVKSTLFPSTASNSKTSNLFPSANNVNISLYSNKADESKSTFPSKLFPSSNNVSSSINNVKSDLDYEEQVLLQMRKKQDDS